MPYSKRRHKRQNQKPQPPQVLIQAPEVTQDFEQKRPDASVALNDPSNELKKRLRESLNVSGAFDNCFFHAYATYLLTNNLPLPNDLFGFTSISGAQSPCSQLQSLFSNEASLRLFKDYDGLRNPGQVAPFPNYLVEKTLVLGFLLREWFATRLYQNSDYRDEMLQAEDGCVNTFSAYKREMIKLITQDAKDEEIGNTKEMFFSATVLSESNKDFMEYLCTRPDSGTLPDEEKKRFPDYFKDAKDDEKAIEAYFKNEGYKKYCLKIAESPAKLSYKELIPVLVALKQPFILYNQNGTLLSETKGDDRPTMEIMLDAQAGHYHLLRTNATEILLQEYKDSFQQYLADRAAILSSNDSLAAAHTKKSLFVDAICKPETLPDGKEPFKLLTTKITLMQDSVSTGVLVNPVATSETDSNHYSFLLQAGAMFCAALSLSAFAVAALALASLIALPVIAPLILGGVAGLASLGMFACSGRPDEAVNPNTLRIEAGESKLASEYL